MHHSVTRALTVLVLVLTGILETRQDDLDPILGRPWQPITVRQKTMLQAKFFKDLNRMLTECYQVEKGDVCRQKMMDVPMDVVYRVHPHQSILTVGRRRPTLTTLNCWQVENGDVCRQKMMDVPMDMVYRAHRHRW
ncbi:hypothetical protein J6590_019941 [Homalodisca vitripennis]|nr:hypothetical protein J6590_059295 [Homalodisca vitripennis]KAG8290047.1 hypothetical protein J6590_091601 [Homalodisca vitripennis]KAG8324683.1 hypothetical protein J6590_086678 [Homalodisca vitripennis]KAG8337540.1 hypothetical protein J6590_019941 [Homalodisca vitripennis]